MSQFDWPITRKKMKLWRLPKIEGSILKCRIPPLQLTYIGEWRTTFAKDYWDKSRLECMLGPSHWLHEIYLPKRVCQDFWPGLLPLCKEHPTYSTVLAELCRLSFTSQVPSKSDVKTRAKNWWKFSGVFWGEWRPDCADFLSPLVPDCQNTNRELLQLLYVVCMCVRRGHPTVSNTFASTKEAS
jgi:hypothetical protein